MDLSRREYPSMLASVSPAHAVSIFGERVKHIGKLNLEIADWLQERRRVEEVYLQGLRKLGRRQPSDNASELGVFTGPWQKIIKSTETLAESHFVLAQKIENDVERPLRQFTLTDSEYQAMTTIYGNLASMAKEVEAANKKAEKLKDKGTKAAVGKVASATAEVDSAYAQWESQAPFIFEKLQAVDESRINHLRDVLTQFQTHELDQTERNRSAAESCLNALLNVNTTDEILAFVGKFRKDQPMYERQSSKPVSSPLAPPKIPATSDRGDLENKLGPASENKPSGLSGLKRLSTVLGRRRQTMHPYGRSSLSPDRKSSSNLNPSVSSLKRKTSKQNNVTNSIEPPFNLSSRLNDQSEDDQVDGSSAARNATSSIISSNEGKEQVESAKSDLLPGQKSSNYVVNGETVESVAGSPANRQPENSETVASTPNQKNNNNNNSTSRIAVADPITEAQEEAAKVGNVSLPQFRVDIRKAPIAEEGPEADAALANVANTLRAQATTVRKPGTVRGRRDVRNTMFIPSSQPVYALTSSDRLSSIPPSASSPLSNNKSSYKFIQTDDHTLSDTQSVRSNHSLGSSTSVAMKHPEFENLGLNASTIETVNAWIRDGKVMKATVIGEVALAYNPSDMSSASGTLIIRMDNFPVLEKVAPNPVFVKQLPERLGEYTIQLGSILRTSVAFKYQVHLEEGSMASHVPLILAPIWKVESSQASVILSYYLNPAFTIGSGVTITLKNLVIIIHLEDAKATSCQSKPVGTFSRERSAVYWRLGEVVLKSGQEAEQLRARFHTESEGKAGQTEARWEMDNGNATKIGSGLRLSQTTQTMSTATPRSDAGVDPFADEGVSSSSSSGWTDVSMVKKVISGTFVAS